MVRVCVSQVCQCPRSSADASPYIINYFLPHESLYQYHYEADSIAYNTRKNSSLKTVEKLVREYLPDVDENLYHQLAVAIKASL